MFHAIALAKVEQGTPEWIELRKQGIGGSDAAAALGLSQYKTPYDLWKDKRGFTEAFAANWNMKRGTALEPLLRDHYAEKTGRSVRVPEHILQHPTHKFMIASLDGYTDDGRIQEFKTSSVSKGWGEEGTDEIPQMYMMQVQHNMIVTGAEVTDVSVSIGGNEPKYYEVRADAELHQMIIDGEAAFWDRVQNGIEPDPVSIEEMRRKFTIHEGMSITATPEMMHTVSVLHELKGIIKKAEEEQDQCKEQVQRFLLENGAPILVDAAGNPLVTWNESKPRVTLDTKLLKAEMPDIYDRYSKTGNPTRTFLLK